MDYILKDIPSELWAGVVSAAAIRGLSVRAFVLSAAFNELERTGVILSSSSASKEEKEAVTQPLIPVAPSKNQEKYLRMLRTVGISTFINDFELLRDSTNKKAVEMLQDIYKYEYTSASTKVSTGKRLIRDQKLLADCFSYIINIANVDQAIRNKAEQLRNVLIKAI